MIVIVLMEDLVQVELNDALFSYNILYIEKIKKNYLPMILKFYFIKNIHDLVNETFYQHIYNDLFSNVYIFTLLIYVHYIHSSLY